MNKQKILIVEDDPIIALNINGVLDNVGVDAFIKQKKWELKITRKKGVKIALVIPAGKKKTVE